MKNLLILVLVLLASEFCNAQEELNNNSIIELVKMGFGNKIIKAKIDASVTKFNTSIKAIKLLQENNVTNEIIALMITKSKVEVETGIFYYDHYNTLKKLQTSVFTGTRTNSLGSALTYGIASAKMKSIVNNINSVNVIGSNQTFTFVFDSKTKNKLGNNNWWFRTSTSPNEFVLTKLKIKASRKYRELVTGKINILGGSTQIGIEAKKTIPFNIEDMGNGKFKVTPKITLSRGEYCFFYKGTVPMGGITNKELFDFSVR